MRNFNNEEINVSERLIEVNERISVIEKCGGQAFGTDAFLLSAYAQCARPGMAAVDLGSGSGICALLLCDRNKAEHVYSVELQSELCNTANRNIKLNGLEEKMSVIGTDLRLVDKKTFEHPIDLVIANPPYFQKGSGKLCPDPGRNAARFEMNGTLYDFCACASRIMRPGARFFCVIRPERLTDLVSSLRSVGLELRTMTAVAHHADSEPSILLCMAERSHSTALHMTRTLILRKENGEMTDETQHIYNTCDFGDFLK